MNGKSAKCPGCGGRISIPSDHTVVKPASIDAQKAPNQPQVPIISPSAPTGPAAPRFDNDSRKSKQPTSSPEGKKNEFALAVNGVIAAALLNLIVRLVQGKHTARDIGIAVAVVAIALAVKGTVTLIRYLSAGGTGINLSPSRPGSPQPPPPIPIPKNASTTAPNDEWLVEFGGRVTGPFTTQSVREAVSTSDFSPETSVCPVGSSQWKPISAWSEFAANAIY